MFSFLIFKVVTVQSIGFSICLTILKQDSYRKWLQEVSPVNLCISEIVNVLRFDTDIDYWGHVLIYLDSFHCKLFLNLGSSSSDY